jgi:hypothetical protein
MTRDVRVLTGAALVMPVALLVAASLSVPSERGGLIVVVACLSLVYASVWLAWRPTRFEVDATTLRIVWPVRVRAIPRHDVRDVTTLTGAELRDRYGCGMRIGVGGLWGGFGLLKTRARTFSMWISRTDRLVVVDLAGTRPLLLTPEDPERFVETLRR